MGSSGGRSASRFQSVRYSQRPTSMFFTRLMTSPIVVGSMPRSSTPAVFDELDAMASPPTTGVAACTPGTLRTSSWRSR